MEIITNSATETKTHAQTLADTLNSGDIICLYGELGAGKTTFTQGIASRLRISDWIVSPTYTLIHQYNIPNNVLKKLYHVDLYRIETETELNELGLAEIFQHDESIIIIEWAEKAKGHLPKERIDIFFNYQNDNSRIIHINDFRGTKQDPPPR